MKEKWIRAFMDTADRFSQLSSAIRLKVGAVVVKDNRIISIGYNGTPSGWDNKCENEEYADDGFHITLTTKPEVIHAEMNAIAKLASSNESAKDSSMFITHAPCMSCASIIAACRIKEVYYRYSYRNNDGIKHLIACGVDVIHADTNGGITLLKE